MLKHILIIILLAGTSAVMASDGQGNASFDPSAYGDIPDISGKPDLRGLHMSCDSNGCKVSAVAPEKPLAKPEPDRRPALEEDLRNLYMSCDANGCEVSAVAPEKLLAEPEPDRRPALEEDLRKLQMNCDSNGCAVSVVEPEKRPPTKAPPSPVQPPKQQPPQKTPEESSPEQKKKNKKATSKAKKLLETVLNKITEKDKAPKPLKKIMNKGAAKLTTMYADAAYDAHNKGEVIMQRTSLPEAPESEVERAQKMIEHLNRMGK